MMEVTPIEDQYREHIASIVQFCLRMIGHREKAEELAQDVFLEAWRRNRYETSWLFACARNRCIDYLRRGGVWNRVWDRLRGRTPLSTSFEEELVRKDLGLRVLSRLNPRERSLLLLKEYAGLNYQEIGEILGLKPDSVGVGLSRARARAAKMLEKEQIP